MNTSIYVNTFHLFRVWILSMLYQNCFLLDCLYYIFIILVLELPSFFPFLLPPHLKLIQFNLLKAWMCYFKLACCCYVFLHWVSIHPYKTYLALGSDLYQLLARNNVTEIITLTPGEQIVRNGRLISCNLHAGKHKANVIECAHIFEQRMAEERILWRNWMPRTCQQAEH